MSGISVAIGKREFTLSALTLGDLRRLEPALLAAEQKMTGGFGSMLALVPVIHASISKLHPQVALEELENLLDLNNFSEVLDRVLEASGLKRTVPSAVADGCSGETKPAAE